ncbi:MAG: hypothetical protein HOJ76_03960, partial [Proteobacteria bacterium]|nr:hypothetical protein [Pseudomonadota bacterium]
MNTRGQGFIRALALTAAAMATSSVAQPQATADVRKPNVVVVFVDDL